MMKLWKAWLKRLAIRVLHGISYRRFIQMYGDVVLGLKPANKKMLILSKQLSNN
jgi:hypothetical protein